MTTTETTILKTDVLGRVTTSAARREQILDEFERSGLPGLKFAELIGVKYQTFATWAQKRRRQRGDYAKLPAAKKPVRWLEAVVAPAAGMTNRQISEVVPAVWGKTQRPLQVQLAS